MKPLISIVIPSNNSTNLLSEAILSITSESGWNSKCELCISDNSEGSETSNFINTQYSTNPKIVYRRSLDALTLDENVNMAVSIARGEYVWIFGDDDLICKNYLATLVSYLDNSSPDILILNSISFQEKGLVENSRLFLDTIKVYGPNDNDVFMSDLGGYITYVGCIVIRKKLWTRYFRPNKVGTYFAHLDTVCRAKIGHIAHYLPAPAIKMRLHMQTWTAKHFEIWNIYYPDVVWDLSNYSSDAKKGVIQRYPLKSIKRILASRAYGRFNFAIFRKILIPFENSSSIVKVIGFFIAILPQAFFRFLYIKYILIFKLKHTNSFSPKLALSQLQKRPEIK